MFVMQNEQDLRTWKNITLSLVKMNIDEMMDEICETLQTANVICTETNTEELIEAKEDTERHLKNLFNPTKNNGTDPRSHLIACKKRYTYYLFHTKGWEDEHNADLLYLKLAIRNFVDSDDSVEKMLLQTYFIDSQLHKVLMSL